MTVAYPNTCTDHEFINQSEKNTQVYIFFYDVDCHDGLLMMKDTVAHNPSFLWYFLYDITYTDLIHLNFVTNERKIVHDVKFAFSNFS